MLLIYIMSGAQSHDGHLNSTYRLPNLPTFNTTVQAKADPSVLSWTTAPRNVEDISANGSVRGPSYHYQGNPVAPVLNSNNNKFESDELDHYLKIYK